MTRRLFASCAAVVGFTGLLTAGTGGNVMPPGDGEEPGAVLELPTGDGGGQADDINQWGFIVGSAITKDGRRAFRAIPHQPLRFADMPGHSISLGIGINDFGDIVGESTTGQGRGGAFAQIGSHAYVLPFVSASDINNLRLVAGWTRQAGIWSPDGIVHLLFTPTMPPDDDTGGWWSGALGGINDRGQAAGFYVDASGTPHAVRWEPNGSLTELGLGTPTAINEAGDVAGWGYNTPNFLWRDGVGRTAVDIYALALNDARQLAGLCGNGTPFQDACVWSESAGTIRLTKPVEGTARATGINDLGEVVGHLGEQGRAHALWWYVPPPVTDQLAAAKRLLRILRDDRVLNHGRYTALLLALQAAETAQAAGDTWRAAKLLQRAGRQLAVWRRSGGDRLTHLEALVSRLAIRLTQ